MLQFQKYYIKQQMKKINLITSIKILFLLVLFTLSKSMQHEQIRTQDIQERKFYLPEGFVYIDQIDPTIITNLRYLTTQNFVGEVLVGYYVNRAIMTKQTAIALKNANQQFSKDGYQIVVYDSYRPQKTVNRFVQWSLNESATQGQQKYYPSLDKSVLFQKGYIARKSGHTRGSTVDISIIRKDMQLKPIQLKLRQLQNGRLIFLLDDNTVDFGSSFDLFDEASHPQNNTLLPKQYLQKRIYLKNIMQRNGFKILATEWWHFTLVNQPFPTTYFDFDIK